MIAILLRLTLGDSRTRYALQCPSFRRANAWPSKSRSSSEVSDPTMKRRGARCAATVEAVTAMQRRWRYSGRSGGKPTAPPAGSGPGGHVWDAPSRERSGDEPGLPKLGVSQWRTVGPSPTGADSDSDRAKEGTRGCVSGTSADEVRLIAASGECEASKAAPPPSLERVIDWRTARAKATVR